MKTPPDAQNKSLPPDREILFQVFFYCVFLLLLYQLGRLARPFLPALMGAAGLSLAFYPLHARLVRRFALRPNAGALLSTLLVLAMIVVPFGLAAGAIVKEAPILTATARKIVSTLNELDKQTVLAELPDRLRPLGQSVFDFFATLDIDLGALLVLGASRVGEAFLQFGGQAARNALFIGFDIALTALTLFYAFRDGASLLRWALQLIPMPTAHKQAVARRVYDTFRAVIVGSLLTALLQGLVATIGFALVGMRLPWLLGLATAAFALFPSAQLVILPLSAYTLSFDIPRGLVLCACVLAIQSLEHLVKPVLIGTKARLPAILLFFAMFGALFAYGFFGLILGPLLVTAVLAFVEIYRTEYYLPPVEGDL
jgi:predicted PurR-regulated permease PerM